MIKYILFFVLFLFVGFSHGQNSVGLISYDITQSYQGYSLIYPHNQPNVYLIDNCGEIVHTWEDDEGFRPGNTAYLRDDGSIVKTKRPSSIVGDAIWAGGGGAIVEIRSWENDLLWSFELNNEEARLHHDVEPLPNGNILMLAWERVSREDAIAAGRDTATLLQGDLWPDYIFEMNPETDEVVWEWHAWDHLIQDHDSTKANYGVIADHPELINLNWDTNDGKSDWMHSNSIDYNRNLDQVMISVPQFHEIWIIDHTTTTEQAATGFGGFVNRGGNLLYRVGNLQAYDKGTADDQILFYQHDAHWSNEFIPESSPFANQIVCFNNRVGDNYSTIEVFPSQWMDYVVDYPKFQGAWPPFELENTITHPDTFSMYSTGLSSAQLLPNGNILACSGRQGYQFELTPQNKIVWEYVTPLLAGNPVEQGTELELNNNLTFRSFKYPIDYEAFDGKDLTPKGFLELNPDETYCDRLVDIKEPEEVFSMIYPNPASSYVQLTWDSGKLLNIQIVDALGIIHITTMGNGGMTFIDIEDLVPGIYYVVVEGLSSEKLIKF